VTAAILRLAVLALALLVAGAVRAQAEPSARDWTQIKAVIAAQRDALVSGDGARAFTYAAPGIRRSFGDVETFMRMVRQSYAALIDARYVEFLEGAVIGGDVVQPLRLVMNDGTVWVALYGMQRQDDGSWRIASCVIAPSTVRSA
jgi:hypothetical protein